MSFKKEFQMAKTYFMLGWEGFKEPYKKAWNYLTSENPDPAVINEVEYWSKKRFRDVLYNAYRENMMYLKMGIKAMNEDLKEILKEIETNDSKSKDI